MSFELDFLELMTEWVDVYPVASTDGYGAAVAGPVTHYVPAHITYRSSSQRDDEKESSNRYATVILPPTGMTLPQLGRIMPTVTVGSQLKLPDGVTRTVIKSTQAVDESGSIHHQSADVA